MGFAIGNGHERRQQTLVLQPDMEFDGAPGGTEFGPGKYLETQVDG